MAPRSHASLLGACLLLGALLCILGLVLQGRKSSSRGESPASQPAPAPPAVAELTRADPSSPEVRPERVSLDVSLDRDARGELPEQELASAAPARIWGRLRLDGVGAEGGRVFVRSEDGTWEGSVAIDHEGRFWLGDVPSSKLELSFELARRDERQLVLPRVEVQPAPGGSEELDLDWQPRHVNVRVLGDGVDGNRARVDIEGPGTRASIETDENGKARLSLVGQGLFTFRAVQPSGGQGTTVLELEEGAGLDSVVITAMPPPGG